MAKLTWLGEDDYHDGKPGPSFCIGFGGIKFPKDQPVEVTDKNIIAKARRNKFFDVEGPDEFVSTHPEPKRRGRPPKMTPEAQIDQRQ
jgi:hypothetical protein